jgi:hypothetical protein
VEGGGSESWEDKVGEEIEVGDRQEELGGGKTEPMRSQVREESLGEGSVGGRDTDFGDRGVVTGKEDFNSVTRLEQGGLKAERKESLDEYNFVSLAIAMAEIIKT